MRALVTKYPKTFFLIYLVIGYKCGLTWAPEVFSTNLALTHYEDYNILFWLVTWPLGLALNFQQEAMICLAVAALFLVAYLIQHLRNIGRISRFL